MKVAYETPLLTVVPISPSILPTFTGWVSCSTGCIEYRVCFAVSVSFQTMLVQFTAGHNFEGAVVRKLMLIIAKYCVSTTEGWWDRSHFGFG